jgi:hypothetical protein
MLRSHPVKNTIFYLKDDASDKNHRFLKPFDGVDVYCAGAPRVSKKIPIGQIIEKAMLSDNHSVTFLIEDKNINLVDGIK